MAGQEVKSTFLSTGMGYIYTLGDEVDVDLLTIEVSQLRSRGGSPLALLSTSTTIERARRIPGGNRVLNAEVWLLSDSSRTGYATALAQRIPTPKGAAAVDFTAVLEELAQQVIDAENAPVLVVNLDMQHRRKPTPWLVEGILPGGKPTILYGAGGVGKSIVAAALAVAVQTGTRWLGLRVSQAEVLYLDWETDEADIAARVAAAARGLGPTTEPQVRYASLVRPIEDRVAQLARYVAQEKIGLVIIDSVGMAMSTARDGSDASETAIRFFRALRSLDTSVLAIDHVSGEDMRKGKGSAKPYGSVYKWNSARNAFELREDREPDMHGSHLVLKHRKSNIGPRMDDLFLNLVWGEDSVLFTREKHIPMVAVPIIDRVRDILSVAPATPRAITELLTSEAGEVDIYEMDVRLALKELKTSGEVVVLADGTARLRTVESEGQPE